MHESFLLDHINRLQVIELVRQLVAISQMGGSPRTNERSHRLFLT